MGDLKVTVKFPSLQGEEEIIICPNKSCSSYKNDMLALSEAIIERMAPGYGYPRAWNVQITVDEAGPNRAKVSEEKADKAF